jgi:hypothetical protein
MKYLLLPFSLLISFIIPYLGLGFIFDKMVVLLLLPGFWFFIVFSFSIFFAYKITILPSLFIYSVLQEFYRKTIVLFLHFLVSFFAICVLFFFLMQNDYSSEGNVFSLLYAMMEFHPIKTVLIFLFFISIILLNIFSLIVSPFLLGIENEEEY